MWVPGVEPVVAITFKTAIDDVLACRPYEPINVAKALKDEASGGRPSAD
jgi:hypothetical protein